MFWGVTLTPGQPCTKVFDKTVCLSMAALESRQNGGSGFTQVVIQSEGADHLLCTLMSGVIFQQYMNVKLSEGEEVTLSVEGPGVVHLTGFTVQPEGNHNEYSSTNAVDEEYYDGVEDQSQAEEQFTVKMERSSNWEDRSQAAPEMGSETPYMEPSHVITVTDADSDASEIDAPWQDVSGNAMVPTQADYPETPVRASLSLQGNSSSEIPHLSSIEQTKSERINGSQSLPNQGSQFLPNNAVRRAFPIKIRGNHPGDWKNQRRSAKPKAASAHKAEEEAIEARRRRWRLAKREQRKKNRERTTPYGEFYGQSEEGPNFFSSTPGPSTSVTDEPIEDIYHQRMPDSEHFEIVAGVMPHQENIKIDPNNFGST